jgi:hypothetical protein
MFGPTCQTLKLFEYLSVIHTIGFPEGHFWELEKQIIKQQSPFLQVQAPTSTTFPTLLHTTPVVNKTLLLFHFLVKSVLARMLPKSWELGLYPKLSAKPSFLDANISAVVVILFKVICLACGLDMNVACEEFYGQNNLGKVNVKDVLSWLNSPMKMWAGRIGKWGDDFVAALVARNNNNNNNANTSITESASE